MATIPLLMTAAIHPRGMVGADFSAEAREKMYLETMAYYIGTILKNPEQKIVFVDNSGWDLKAFAEKLPPFNVEQIEFIALERDSFDISRGKGYNEFLLISMAIRQSETIVSAKSFLKVTGRYPIYNLSYFLRKASSLIYDHGIVFYGDIKDHNLYKILHLKWNGHGATSVLFASRTDEWMANIEPLCTRLNDYKGYWAEHLIYDYIHGHNLSRFNIPRAGGVICRFGREMRRGGLNGFQSSKSHWYKDNQSLLSFVDYAIGNFIRLFMPWFWF